MKKSTASIAVLAVAAGILAMTAPAFANTEITATKTLNVCTIDSTKDRYSGLITVTNTGLFPGIHLELNDCIGGTLPLCTGGILVPGSGTGPWVNPSGPCSTLPFGGFALVPPNDPNFNTTDCSIANPGAGLGNVPGTLVFSYTVDGPARTPPITNNANPTIQNFDCQGPSCPNQGPTVPPTKTFTGTVPPCTSPSFGCTLTIGFWKNHTNVWPAGFSPTMPWFSNTMHIDTETWLSALTGGPTHNNGYWILARAYIGATLNQAKNGSAPPDVVSTLALASAFFTANDPSVCDAPGSCSDQKGLAAILQVYNQGELPGGPKECQ